MARLFGEYNTVTLQTTHATPGTTTTHAHGLTVRGAKVTPRIVVIRPTGTDAAPVDFVSVDDTNVTVKSTAASATFEIDVIY